MERHNGKSLHVYIAGDHEVVRAGLRTILESTLDITVVGEADTRMKAVEDVVRLRPDLVLMDVRLKQGSGIEACRDIRRICRNTRILLFTAFTEEDLALDAALAGAHGYLSTLASSTALLSAVQAIAAGRTVFDTRIARGMSELRSDLATEPRTGLENLSPQEQRVLTLVAEGRTNKEVAAELDLSEKTVKNYLAHIYDKLNISRRAQAAALYARGIRAVTEYAMRTH